MSDENNIPSRVSISYSVDLVEVPDRVKILMNELANSFGGIAKLCREAANEVVDEPVAGTRKIAELKTLIEKSVVRADDSIEIMLGYIRILQQVAAQKAQEEQPPVEEAPVEEPPKKKTKKKKAKKKSTKKKEK
tara:strand:+ start:1124 stop:1525 length:402 start_codon:yes stop_codon:yes gene_type:complete